MTTFLRLGIFQSAILNKNNYIPKTGSIPDYINAKA